MKSSSLRNNSFAYSAGIILFFLVIRIWFVATGQLNFVQDEAQYWDWTRHLQLTYYSKGPLLTWLIAASTSFFGNTEFGVRFVAMFFSTATQILIYFGIACLWRRPDAAIATLLIYNTIPVFLGLSILCTTDMLFVFFWTASLFCLFQASLPNSRNGHSLTLPFFWMSLAFGLGILAKYTMLGFIGLAGLYGLILHYRSLKPLRFWRKLVLAMLIGLSLGFLPTFIWNMHNDFVGYKHVFQLIGISGKQAVQFIRFDRFPDYIGSQFGLATPWWLVFMLMGGVSAVIKGLSGTRHITVYDERPTLDVRQAILLAVFFWPIWLFFLAWSFHAKVMPNWTTVSYISGVILASYSFLRILPKIVANINVVVFAILFSAALILGWGQVPTLAFIPLFILLVATVVLRPYSKQFLVFLSFSFFLFVMLLPQIPFPQNLDPLDRLKGWNDLGQHIELETNTRFPDPSKVFIFSDLYDMTAALAFYVPNQPRTYCAWIDDRRMNQYDLWPGPQDKTGWNAIFVRKHNYGEPHPEILNMFDRVEGPFPFQSMFNGRNARQFTLYYCYSFNGYWPRNEGYF